MPPSDLLIAFFTAAAIFAFIPGSGLLYAATQPMAGGRTIGLLITPGLALGG
jgi:threonine/homoserine/homoserine lactone efflux protein